MKFYNKNLVNKARIYRKRGLSLRAIEKQINVPNSTISKWVRDIKSPNYFYKNARLQEKKHKDKESFLFNHYSIDINQAKIFVSLLYWCEGSKYPSSNCVAFSNSDPSMMKTFIQLLRKGFSIDEKKFRVRLQLHSTHNKEKENNYWSELLGIPLVQFGKPTITIPKNKRKRLNYRGTCTIKYYDVKLLLNILGIYEQFGTMFQGGIA